MPGRIQNIVLENARLVFKNFEGREGKFNRKGDRSFSVLLDDKQAADLEDEGWNVKVLKPREEGDAPQKYMTVSVRFPEKGSRGTAPKIVLIGSRGQNELDEDSCEFVDQVDIKSVDLEIRPYEWVVQGNTGVKAYLKELYVIVNESYLGRKYQDVPEIGSTPTPLAIEAGPGDNDVWDAEVVQDDTLEIEA